MKASIIMSSLSYLRKPDKVISTRKSVNLFLGKDISMRIAFINPEIMSDRQNKEKQNEPVSIQYLKSYLNQYGYECDCFDFRIFMDADAQIVKIASHYEVVGISVFYPYNPLILAQKLKTFNPAIIIVLGGPGAKLNYKSYLQDNSPVNFVVFNEGEEKLKLLMDYLYGKILVTDLKGLAFRTNKEIIVIGKASPMDIDEIHFPVRDPEEIGNYIPSIVSSRGCNGRCTFCSNSYMGKWRGRNYINVVDEVEYLNKSLKQRYFQFIEPNFLGDNERGLQIAKEIIKRKLKVSFDFSCRVDSLIEGKEVLKYLKNAGTSRILLGVENFYDNTLKAWQKEITNQDILDAITFLKKIELPFTISLILFHKNMTMEELEFNMNIIDTEKIGNKIDNLFNKMIFYPGTGLNRTNKIIEWEFKSDRIKNIYKKCISYTESQKKLRTELLFFHKHLETIEKVDSYILRNLYYFENVKAKEFAILKYYTDFLLQKEDNKLLTYQDYSAIHFVFCLNPKVKVSEEEDNYIFSNMDTGFSYYANPSSYLIYRFTNHCTYYEFTKKLLDNFGPMEVKDYFRAISVLFQLVYMDIMVLEK